MSHKVLEKEYSFEPVDKIPEPDKESIKHFFYDEVIKAFVEGEHRLVRVEVTGGGKPGSVYQALKRRVDKMSGIKVSLHRSPAHVYLEKV